MAINYPVGVKAQGNTAYAFGTAAPTNPSAPSVATDLNFAAAGLNASCYVYGDWEGTVTVNKGAAPRRACTQVSLQQFGEKSTELPTLSLVWDPTKADSDEVNAAKAMVADGAELWVYIRRGKPAETEEFVATDRVEIRHIKVDGGRPGKTGDGEFDEFSWQVDAIDQEPPRYGIALVA